MLLSTPEQIEQYSSSGHWGEDRLDVLFARQAKDREDDLALVDDQDLHAISGRKPQCLSFIRTWRRVVALSEFLTGIGMKSDTVVAMLLPPGSDAAVITLVASRLGLILAPLPLISGEADIKEKLEQVGAKAIVCCSHYEDEPVAERVRNVAADMFSIRFVFCLGDGAPEGLIDLAPVLEEEDSVSEEALFEHSYQISANSVLALHWSAAGSERGRPIGRSHNHLLAQARYVSEQTDLVSEDCIFVTHHLSGLVGFVSGLVSALDVGARVQFHAFKSNARLCQTLAEFGGQHVSLPGGQWQAIHDLLPMPVREQLKSVTLVWNKSHVGQTSFGENETAARIVDLTDFHELVLFSQIRRDPSEIGPVSVGEIASIKDPEMIWMETFLFGMEEARARGEDKVLGGELCLKGPMLPDCAYPLVGMVEGEALPRTEEGFIHTEIGCRVVQNEVDEQKAMFQPLGDLADVLTIGGFAERGRDLDDLYRQCSGVSDAAAFLAPCNDGGPGQLMAALVVDDRDIGRELFYGSLKDMGVSKMKWPREVIFVEAIPRHTNGKVMRDSLIAASDVSNVA
ncbi:class I adenylate-forming enzyme family protein [uncultured Cohaesibacter sp.]|uniref:class I adenylate-forming enzyme family protein n=1 Tax=uncultured Cohaesibacter sp. TaxID=1002546 RepID=UPI00292E2137|nr:class I adenylate-forming enzyme family protein [uncultured Cohaesibacter sp.]